MKNKRLRNVFITIFVIVWTVIFHYESTRVFYLDLFFPKPLPKVKFLFPPAGWIMFYNVSPQTAFVEVYGIKDNIPQWIDPHKIFLTRAIGYDNIHRGVLGSALSKAIQEPFCTFLERKFPFYDDFVVMYIHYPSVIEKPQKRQQAVAYRCR